MNKSKKAKVSKKTVDVHGVERWKLPDGRLHRENGPAYSHPDGAQVWYLNGKHHREDGPAFIYPNGVQYWCLNGVCIKGVRK